MKVFLIFANTEPTNKPVLPLGLAYVAAAAASQGHSPGCIPICPHCGCGHARRELNKSI